MIDVFCSEGMNIELSQDRKFIKKKSSFLKTSGYAYVDRPLEAGSKCIFSFRIVESLKMDIQLGFEQEMP